MRHKSYSWLIFLLFIFMNSQEAAYAEEGKLSFHIVGGGNLSRPIAVPEHLGRSFDKDYRIFIKPGVHIAGLTKLSSGQAAIATGLGFKNLNFNFERNFTGTSSISIKQAIPKPRLYYIFIPFKLYLRVKENSKVYLTASGEFSWLLDTENEEIQRWPDTKFSSLEWFTRFEMFFYLGVGCSVHKNLALELEGGFTPSYVDEEPIPLEGAPYSWFSFQKKLLEIRFSLSYQF